MKCASFVLVATIAAMTLPAASAQSVGGRSRTAAASFDVPPSWQYVPDRETCLFNKVTKKNECHTRDGWRRIAAKLKRQKGTTSDAVPN